MDLVSVQCAMLVALRQTLTLLTHQHHAAAAKKAGGMATVTAQSNQTALSHTSQSNQSNRPVSGGMATEAQESALLARLGALLSDPRVDLARYGARKRRRTYYSHIIIS